MNKKFSTLVASLLLAGAVGTVNAATVEKGAMSGAPYEVAKAIDGKFYQLAEGNMVLTMERTSNGTYVLKFVDFKQAELAKTLWEIKATDNKDEKGLAFQFFNVSTGLPISVDVAKANVGDNLTVVEMAQGVNAWSWMRGVEGDALKSTATIEAFFGANRDSVVTLVNTANGVAAKKYATKDVASVSGIKVKPMVASSVYLNAYDLNTMLQTGKSNLQLAFNPDAKENPFTANQFTATDAVATNTLSVGPVKDAEKAVAEAGAEEQRLLKVYDEAGLAFINLDGKSQLLWDELRKAEEAVKKADETILLNEGFYSSNERIKDDWTKHRDEYIAVYEKELKLSEAQRVEMENARTTMNAKQKVMDDAKAALDLVEGEQDELKAAWDKAEDDVDAALQAMNAASGVNTYVSLLLQEAAKSSGNGATFVADLDERGDYASALYIWLKDNAPEDASKIYYYLGTTLATSTLSSALTLDAQNAYLADYQKAFNDALTAWTGATTATKDAENAYNAIESDVTAATKKYTKAETAFRKAETTFLGLLATYESASAEAKEWKDKIDNAQAKIDEAWGEMTKALENIAVEKATYAEKKAKVAELTVEFEEADTEYTDAKQALTTARIAYNKAWAAYQSAKAYLATLEGQDDNWLSLKVGDKYMMLDTAFHENSGTVYANQKFALKAYTEAKVEDGFGAMSARDINGRFNYRFNYFPTQDSLVITVDGGNGKVVNKTWKERDERFILPVDYKNYVKLALLGANCKEVTAGPAENYLGTADFTLNTRVGLGLIKNTPGIEIPAGLFHIDVVNTEDAQKNGARLMVDLDGTLTKVAPAEWDVMNFDHMPAAKWIVTGSTLFGDSPEIINQETKEVFNNGMYKVASVENGVVTLEVSYFYQGGVRNETVKLTPAQSTADGYFSGDTKNKYYTLNYLSVNDGLAISVGNSTVGKDTILRVSSEATKFDLELVKKYTYGQAYGDVKKLEKATYLIRVNDSYKFANNHKYVQVSDVDGTEMLVVVEGKENATPFFLKEVNDVDGHYYALIAGDKKAGVIDASGLIKAEDITAETTTSAFALNPVDVNLYREFAAKELGENGAMKFYRVNSTEKAYLYEGANSLLCVEGKGDNAAEAFNVISTGVKETIMPQYLIAKDVKFVEGTEDLCEICGKPDCDHSFATKDTTFGRFLVNMIDSVPANKLYTWENKYSRLAFLPGYITEDVLSIEDTDKKVALSTLNKHDQTKFSFRLISDDSNDFLIESESWSNNNAFAGGIAPMEKGGWVKIQNGVPVIVSAQFETEAAQADVFNVDTNEGGATANEGIETSEVSVVATDGAIIIKGAEGKKVVITNVLGQQVANTVVSSSEATISAPAGVVVVAVEGEAAVKAIVK